MHANPICQLNPIWCLIPRARPKARVEPDYRTGYAQVGHIIEDMHAFLLDNLMRLIFFDDTYLQEELSFNHQGFCRERVKTNSAKTHIPLFGSTP